MDSNFARNWMWSEACAVLARAENLHREFFRLGRSARSPVWEPPIDILETEGEVLVLVALPGVGADAIEVTVEGSDLLISAFRGWPPELKAAVIHRLELPQGRFERRIRLPAGDFAAVRHSLRDGCLVIVLEKTG